MSERMTGTLIPREILDTVPPHEWATMEKDYLAIVELTSDDCDPQEFLDQFLKHLAALYAAVAGTIWCRAVNATRLYARSRWGDDLLGSNAAILETHDTLMRHAVRQKSPFLIEPHAVLAGRARASNPTASYVLLGPVKSHGDVIAIVELFLGEVPRRGRTDSERKPYVPWLGQLLGQLRQGMETRFLGNLAPLQPALVNLAATRAEIEAFKHAIMVSLEVTVSSYAGSNFGSLQNNQTFTRGVQELLDSNGLRVECPECGAPAILRCQSAGNARTGAFLYDHYLATGRTFHGGPTTFPRLKLVPRPPRRQPQ